MSFLPSVEAAQYWSSIAATIGVPFSLLAVFYAARQLTLARTAGSGATLIALTQSFSDNWKSYLEAKTDASQAFAFADLANMLEAACAIHRDNVLYGHSKTVLEFYLIGVFRLLQDNEQTRNHLLVLLQTKETFENIQFFIAEKKSLINSHSWDIAEPA